MQNFSFKVIVEECDEGGYYAECPTFQGCHVEAESYEEVLIEIKAAIGAFIASYKKDGIEIPQDNFSVASVLVPV